VKLSAKLGQAGEQPNIWGGHGPPSPPLEPPLSLWTLGTGAGASYRTRQLWTPLLQGTA